MPREEDVTRLLIAFALALAAVSNVPRRSLPVFISLFRLILELLDS